MLNTNLEPAVTFTQEALRYQRTRLQFTRSKRRVANAYLVHARPKSARSVIATVGARIELYRQEIPDTGNDTDTLRQLLDHTVAQLSALYEIHAQLSEHAQHIADALATNVAAELEQELHQQPAA